MCTSLDRWYLLYVVYFESGRHPMSGVPNLFSHMAISRISQTEWADHVLSRVDNMETVSWLCECHKQTTLHAHIQCRHPVHWTPISIQTFNVQCTCINWMHEIRVKKPRKFANIKMSHPKIQNEPRWLMSHRLGTPAHVVWHTGGISSVYESKWHCQKKGS